MTDADDWVYTVTVIDGSDRSVERAASTAANAFKLALSNATSSAELEIRQPNGRLISLDRLARLARAEDEAWPQSQPEKWKGRT